MDGNIGEIRGFAGNFAPRGWALCEGQLLPISQNTALFSILGNIYGGDGRTTFALPDLRGRTMVGPGNGPGLSPYKEGARGGSEYNNLTTAQLPAHSHSAALNSARAAANTSNPSNASLAGSNIYENTTAPTTPMSSASIAVSNTGSGQAVPNIQPYISIYYIVCLQGVFPSRS